MERDARELFAIAAVVAALLFGIAGVIGAIGYLVSVSRAPQPPTAGAR